MQKVVVTAKDGAKPEAALEAENHAKTELNLAMTSPLQLQGGDEATPSVHEALEGLGEVRMGAYNY